MPHGAKIYSFLKLEEDFKLFVIFILVSFGLMALMNIYCYVKYKNMLKAYGSAFLTRLLFAIFLLMFLLSISSFVFMKWKNSIFGIIITYTAAAHICFIMYSTLLFLLADALIFTDNIIHFGKVTHKLFYKIYLRGFFVFAMALLITLCGIWNASHLKLTEYSVEIAKKNVPEINIVMLSDMHVGSVIGKKELRELKSLANSLSPDILLVCGDIVDHSSSMELFLASLKTLADIKTKYGVYFVTGNHEMYLDNFSAMLPLFAKYGIKVIDDQAVDLGSFIVAGRGDEGRHGSRIALSSILSESSGAKPIILLDHRPRNLEEARAGGVDLEFAGHTHRGQIFPLNIIASLFNEALYGHVKKGNYNLIVSSGVGVWNEFPVRVGSFGEIVAVKIKSKYKQ